MKLQDIKVGKEYAAVEYYATVPKGLIPERRAAEKVIVSETGLRRFSSSAGEGFGGYMDNGVRVTYVSDGAEHVIAPRQILLPWDEYDQKRKAWQQQEQQKRAAIIQQRNKLAREVDAKREEIKDALAIYGVTCDFTPQGDAILSNENIQKLLDSLAERAYKMAQEMS